MTFDDWWDSTGTNVTPETYRGWEESCRQAWVAGDKAARLNCWNEINAFIKSGPLPGNGCDESAQRNGLVLASNIVSNGMRSNNKIEGSPLVGDPSRMEG